MEFWVSLLTGASIVRTSVMNAGSKFWFACRIASLKGLFFESFTCAFVTCVKEIVNCVAPSLDFIDEAAPKAEPKGTSSWCCWGGASNQFWITDQAGRRQYGLVSLDSIYEYRCVIEHLWCIAFEPFSVPDVWDNMPSYCMLFLSAWLPFWVPGCQGIWMLVVASQKWPVQDAGPSVAAPAVKAPAMVCCQSHEIIIVNSHRQSWPLLLFVLVQAAAADPKGAPEEAASFRCKCFLLSVTSMALV